MAARDRELGPPDNDCSPVDAKTAGQVLAAKALARDIVNIADRLRSEGLFLDVPPDVLDEFLVLRWWQLRQADQGDDAEGEPS